MANYHYEFFAYTNGRIGRILLAQSRDRNEANYFGHQANFGSFQIEKHRVYNN